MQQTFEAWDEINYAIPIGIEVNNKKKFELIRRVAAEKTSKGDYILSDLGYIPTYPDFVIYAERLLKEHPLVGMFHMKASIRICRKGVVDKWPEKKSDFYIPEHTRAYLLKGYQVEPCPQTYCKRLSVS